MAKKQEQERKYAGLAPADLRDAIATADRDELKAIADELEEVGYSREGQTFAAIYERRQELGGRLGEEEKAALERTRAARAAGAELPKVTGQLRGA